MYKIKVMTIFGTRPEAIKMAPLIKELESRDNIKSIVCVTAQHREMLDQVLEIFNIKPDFDLDIMKPNQTLAEITSNILINVERIIKNSKPDIILVHGDTTTAYASAMAGFYNKISVGHVESGLRTYNKYSPFPEEMNRQLISSICDIHFAPTNKALENLISEGKSKQNIFVTGNTAIDALKITIKKDYESEIIRKIGNKKIIVLTAHRRENIEKNLKNIFKAINKITKEFDDVEVIYPIHLNPEIREIAKEVFLKNYKVHMIEPLNVVDFHNLLNKAYMIMTDSGGIQEEATSLGKPVLVLRDTTERPEGVECNTLRLAGIEEESIYNLTKEILNNKDIYEKMSKATNLYGDGFASKYIVNEIIKKFDKQ